MIKMKKGMIVIIAILVIVATLFSACTMNKDIEVNMNTESDREEVPLETEEVMQPVVEDGVALWRFTPSGDTPVLTIGAVSRIVSTDTWQEAWEALTEYTQETWGFSVELIIYQLIEKDNLELEKKAVQSCLSEDIDIFTASLSRRSVIDMESFIDLGQEPYREELETVFAHYPEKYWEYVEKQWGGRYSVSNTVNLHGNVVLELTMYSGKKNPLEEEWNGKEAIGYTWEDWERLFAEWHEWGSVISIDEGNPYLFLNCLNPETQCQVIAPGVGINLETGEAEKILEMEEVQERMQRYQNWMDQGWVSEEIENVSFKTDHGHFNSWLFCTTEQGDIECWRYMISEKPFYYAVNMDGYYGLDFTGIPQNSGDMNLAIEFLQHMGESPELREKMYSIVESFFNSLSESEFADQIGVEEGMQLYTMQKEEISNVELYSRLYEEAIIPSVAGFYFDPAPAEEEIEAIWKIYSASPARRKITIHGGGQNNATFTEDLRQLEEDMEAAGLNEVLAELQRQLEEWKAAQ